MTWEAAVHWRQGRFARPLEPSLGGSQAYAAVRVPVAQNAAIVARLTGALGDAKVRQGEAAVGISVQPASGLPVQLVAERRVALSEDGRNAWQVRAVGGASMERSGWRLDGYGQAGVVGVRSPQAFADGQVRLSTALVGPVRAGALAAGAIQPGAARLDIGPQVRVDLPVSGVPLAILADYRVRVAGEAAPGSGPSLTLAASF